MCKRDCGYRNEESDECSFFDSHPEKDLDDFQNECPSERQEQLRRNRADNSAMVDGFISYEERAEHQGITVIY